MTEEFKPATIKPPISFAELDRIDIRVGTILSVDDVESSNKLLKLTVDFGDHRRCILAGMKQERENPREIEGRQALFVVNLEPKEDDGRDVRRNAFRHRLCGRSDAGVGDSGKQSAERNQSRVKMK